MPGNPSLPQDLWGFLQQPEPPAGEHPSCARGRSRIHSRQVIICFPDAPLRRQQPSVPPGWSSSTRPCPCSAGLLTLQHSPSALLQQHPPAASATPAPHVLDSFFSSVQTCSFQFRCLFPFSSCADWGRLQHTAAVCCSLQFLRSHSQVLMVPAILHSLHHPPFCSHSV